MKPNHDCETLFEQAHAAVVDVAHTHEIRDHEGGRIWRGDEDSMRLIFANLSGANFQDRPSWSLLTYSDYLATMRQLTALAWPGRDDPCRAGCFIELAEVGGRALDSFRFDA